MGAHKYIDREGERGEGRKEGEIQSECRRHRVRERNRRTKNTYKINILVIIYDSITLHLVHWDEVCPKATNQEHSPLLCPSVRASDTSQSCHYKTANSAHLSDDIIEMAGAILLPARPPPRPHSQV